MNDGVTTPLVTVAIPVYNRGNLLHDAIQSVIAQTYKQIELLIVDDGSQEDIETLVRSYQDPRIRFVRNHVNVGMVANWNRCLTLARGDIINVLHSDDMLVPEAVERAVHQFASVDRLGLFCSITAPIRKSARAGKDAALLVAPGVAPVSSAFIARRCIEQCGVFDLTHNYSADQEYFPRIARSFDVIVDGEIAVERNHSRRTVLWTWRQRDFLPHLEKVRTAAWLYAGFEGKLLQERVAVDMADGCRLVAGFIWRYGDVKKDRALGRAYFRTSSKYSARRLSPKETIVCYSSLLPYGFQATLFAGQCARAVNAVRHTLRLSMIRRG